MKFEVGHFYMHDKGRQVAILDECNTYAWGKCYVVEEADKTGHSISIMDKNQCDETANWVEISRNEWLRNFQRHDN